MVKNKFKNLAKDAQYHNIVLINKFCELVTGEYEALHKTLERFVVFPFNSITEIDYNSCEIFEIADMHISLYDVFEFFLLECSVDDFESWYWSFENSPDLKRKMNLKNYLIHLKSKK